VLYFEDDYLEVELAIHIYVDKWPMTELLLLNNTISMMQSLQPIMGDGNGIVDRSSLM
jgi:hypothetical protein